jgi:NAD dependent epimerase/dehydratase family enzyme
MFANREVENAQSVVNHIHQEDIVQIIERVVETKCSGIYNLVAPKHPTKEAVYKRNSDYFGFESPHFLEDKNPLKRIIIGDKIVKKLNYFFTFDDPLAFR